MNRKSPLNHSAAGGSGVTALVLLGLTLAGTAPAQPSTNAPAATDYSAYRIIGERNIFNPNRTGRYIRTGNVPRAVRVDTITLVGIINYGKGDFAFFESSNNDFTKVVETGGQFAGYTVKEVTPRSVKLELDGNPLELRVGAQLRREDGGRWRVTQPQAAMAATETRAAEQSGDSSLETNDVLRKLMQQREQELR